MHFPHSVAIFYNLPWLSKTKVRYKKSQCNAAWGNRMCKLSLRPKAGLGVSNTQPLTGFNEAFESAKSNFFNSQTYSYFSIFEGSIFTFLWANLINIQRLCLSLRLELKKASSGMDSGLRFTVVIESYKHELEAYYLLRSQLWFVTLSCGLRPKLSYRMIFSVLGLEAFLSPRQRIWAINFLKD